MNANLEKLKKEICDFGKKLDVADLSTMTPERFAEVSSMFSMVEEDFADAERELREIERELVETEKKRKELLPVLRDFMRIHIQFRERYFEMRDIDIEHQFRWA